MSSSVQLSSHTLEPVKLYPGLPPKCIMGKRPWQFRDLSKYGRNPFDHLPFLK